MIVVVASNSATLDFGDRREGDFGREHIVEDVVVAQIGVRQHVVADLSGSAAARRSGRSSASTCGRSTATWSQIVFALDGPTPMLTRVMPAPPSADQVVGRHLVPAPRTGRDLRFGVRQLASLVHPTRY